MQGIILSYHRIAKNQLDPWGLRVSPDHFFEHLKIIKQYGIPMSLLDFVESYQSGNAPDCSIVLTFDDGYADNLTLASPLLLEYQVPATIFVTSGYIGHRKFWWDELENIFLRPNTLPKKLSLNIDGNYCEWDLGDAAVYTSEQHQEDCNFCKWRGAPDSRVRFYHDIYDVLWKIQYQDRKIIIKELIEWANLHSSSDSSVRPLTADELIQVSQKGFVEIGAHTVNHLPLSSHPTDVQNKEICESQKTLQNILNKPITSFAYPHGKYSDQTIDFLKNAGFVCACTTVEDKIFSSTDPMQLPRFTVQNWSADKFAGKLKQWLSI